jgi:hypothetical protein
MAQRAPSLNPKIAAVPQIVQMVSASGVFLNHTQGAPVPVMAWALLDDGRVRPLFHAWGSPDLVVWENNDTFIGYTLASDSTMQ